MGLKPAADTQKQSVCGEGLLGPLLLLPCDSYTEANESYLVSSGQQGHVLTNKDILKLGHIVNWGHQFHLQPQF